MGVLRTKKIHGSIAGSTRGKGGERLGGRGRARSFRGEFSGFSGNYGAALATITGPGGGSRGRGLDLLGSVGRLNANVHVL